MLPSFDYVRPDTVNAAVEALKDDGAVVYGGGTDLLGCLREGIFDVKTVVSISRIPALKGIRETADGGLRIGALTTITEIETHPVIRKRYPGLAMAAGEVASPQLRNSGTIGGNLCQKPRCWYYRGEFHCLRKGGGICFAADGENQLHCIIGSDDICYVVHPSDPAPALVALNARLRLVGPEGERTVAAGDFFIPPSVDVTRETDLKTGEIVAEVLLPAPPPGLKSRYRKVRTRRSWDFAIAGVALALQFDGETVKAGRVVLSGAAPIPWRSKPAEAAIMGKRLDEATIANAAEAAVQDAMPLAKNGYKVPIFKGVLTEELMAIA